MKKKIGIFIFIVICSTVMLSDWIERIYIGRLAGLPGRYNSYVGIQKEQKDSIDMLVLGDSESMTSISPMELWKVPELQVIYVDNLVSVFRNHIIC